MEMRPKHALLADPRPRILALGRFDENIAQIFHEIRESALSGEELFHLQIEDRKEFYDAKFAQIKKGEYRAVLIPAEQFDKQNEIDGLRRCIGPEVLLILVQFPDTSLFEDTEGRNPDLCVLFETGLKRIEGDIEVQTTKGLCTYIRTLLAEAIREKNVFDSGRFPSKKSSPEDSLN